MTPPQGLNPSRSGPPPIAFVVMPFGEKVTGVKPPVGPRKVDFDSLWAKVYQPVLRRLGYEPLRADQDLGGIIVVEMIERLAISDAVVADVSIPNPNVYYELGVRHAAKPTNCAVAAAAWAQPPFDVQQVPRAVYPLTSGRVTDQAARAARDVLLQYLRGLLEGTSPIFHAAPRFPEVRVGEARVTQLRDELRRLDDLVGEMRSAEAWVTQPDRRRAALAITCRLAPQGQNATLRESVWLRALQMLRACALDEVPDWIARMPSPLRNRPHVQEQRLFALAKTQSHADAVGALEQLIEAHGGSSERYGLLGGRYKKLYREAAREGREHEATSYLGSAIAAYEQGMWCDLNEYYAGCNLPQLYRARGEGQDEARAQRAMGADLVLIENSSYFSPAGASSRRFCRGSVALNAYAVRQEGRVGLFEKWNSC